MQQFLKWNVDISIDTRWVEDGITLDADKLVAILQRGMPFAYSSDFKVKINSKPPQKLIDQLQGIKERTGCQ